MAIVPHQITIQLANNPLNPTKDQETPEAVYHVTEVLKDAEGNITGTQVGSIKDTDLAVSNPAAKAALDACFSNPDVIAAMASLTPNT